MQLTNDNALGTVDNKSAIFRHQRNFPKVNLLLFNIPDRFCFQGFLAFVRKTVCVKNNKSHHDFQRGSIGHAFLNALFNIIPDITNFIAYKFQRAFSAEIRNGENAFECTLQTKITTLTCRDVLLEKLLI
ncbi:MAG: hypothetical protein BWY90_00896 [Deltaproteobacteria bacterium ADurb.BinA014]|nr:MAG: hypothetical protein BWY90_00896 [Deltaproteobacteria bacterium ADurb.BinA014]